MGRFVSRPATRDLTCQLQHLAPGHTYQSDPVLGNVLEEDDLAVILERKRSVAFHEPSQTFVDELTGIVDDMLGD
jgi:hypothetical protein